VTEARIASALARRPRPIYLMLALTVLPLIVLFGVAVGMALGVRGPDVQVLALALLMLAVALVPLILDFGRQPEQRHLLLFFLMLGWIVYFVLPVFTHYFFEEFFVDAEEHGGLDLRAIHPADLAKGQSVVLVGLLAMLIGYAIPLGRLVPGGIPRPRRDWSLQAGLVVALTTIPLGWVITLGANFGFTSSRLGSGFVGWLANATYFGIALLMLLYLRHRAVGALALMALLIPPTMAFNYFSGSRGLFLTPIAVVVIALIVVQRRIRLRWLLAALVALSLSYPIVEFQRQVILQGNTRTSAWAMRRPVEVVTKTTRFVGSQGFVSMFGKGVTALVVRFDGLGIASVIVRDCPSRVPYQGGWTIAQIPISFIPRLLWRNKPAMTSGQWVTDNFAGGPGIISSTGATWVGELWFSFGWLGVGIGMIVIGLFIRVLHEMLFKAGAVLPAQLMAVIVLHAVPPTLGGALISPINGTIFGAMPLVITHMCVRLLSGTVRPTTPPEASPADLATEARAGI
jgi:hypothetical protein